LDRETTELPDCNVFVMVLMFMGGPGSSFGIATGYGMDGPGMEEPRKKKNPGGGEIFRTRQNRPWGPPSLLYNGYRVFPKGKEAGVWC
jgi:hypothetical protein